MTLEVKIRDEILRRMRGEHDTVVKELKMLNAVIKIPKLCHDFQVALRKRFKDKQIKQLQQQAIAQMVDWQVTDKPAQEVFINTMIDNLDRVKKLDEQYFNYDCIKVEFQNQKLRDKSPTDSAFHQSPGKTILQ